MIGMVPMFFCGPSTPFLWCGHLAPLLPQSSVFPCPRDLFWFCTFIYRSSLLCLYHSFDRKNPKVHSVSSFWLQSPRFSSVPTLSLHVSHCLSPQPDPRLPNRESHSLYLPLTSSPTTPCSNQRVSSSCCSGLWRGRKIGKKRTLFPALRCFL